MVLTLLLLFKPSETQLRLRSKRTFFRICFSDIDLGSLRIDLSSLVVDVFVLSLPMMLKQHKEVPVVVGADDLTCMELLICVRDESTSLITKDFLSFRMLWIIAARNFHPLLCGSLISMRVPGLRLLLVLLSLPLESTCSMVYSICSLRLSIALRISKVVLNLRLSLD